MIRILFAFILFYPFVSLAKKGTATEWIHEYNSCFNNMIDNNRNNLDVSKTVDVCKKQTQTLYELNDGDAQFSGIGMTDSSGQSTLLLEMFTQVEEKSVLVMYNGVCSNFTDPLKKVNRSPQEIHDKLIGDINREGFVPQCVGVPPNLQESKFGFTAIQNKCVRICLDGDILARANADGSNDSMLRCVRCSDYMREHKYLASHTKSDVGTVYAYTRSHTNACEDIDGCAPHQEFKGGECRQRCKDQWTRNKTTYVCEKSPQACTNEYQKQVQEADSQLADFRRRYTGSSKCDQSIQRVLQSLASQHRQMLNTELMGCQKDLTTQRPSPAWVGSYLNSQIEANHLVDLKNVCEENHVENLMLILDPPANFGGPLGE